MTTTQERIDLAASNDHAGLLTHRVEQDLADAPSEFSAPASTPRPAPGANAPPTSFGYGIPMAGVRYYTFAPAG